MSVKRNLLLLILMFAFSVMAKSQNNVAVKTNLLYDAAANANLGFEVGLASHWSAELTGDFNQWTINDHKWKHWLVQPEVRYWFCERFVKSFVALHAIGGEYNVGNVPIDGKFLGSDFSKLKHNRYQGRGLGAGLAYGYALPLNRSWNMEFELGFGYIYFDYDKYNCSGCGKKIESDDHHYVGPTKLAVNLVYVF